MIFAYKIFPVHSLNAVRPIIALGWIFAFTVITTLALTYFHTWSSILLLVVIAFLFFTLFNNPLSACYHWLEKQFLANIKPPSTQESSKNELIAWNLCLKSADIQNNYDIINKTLGDLAFYSRFKIHVIGIYRGNKLILNPSLQEKIQLYDRLFILGSEEQIDAFALSLHVALHQEELEIFDHFMLKTLLLDTAYPLIGHRIDEALRANQIEGMVIGLERKGLRTLRPALQTCLKTNDLLILLLKKPLSS